MVSISLFGQDLHFTHFYHNPINLNPALTGNFKGDIRIGGNLKEQWSSISVPYKTAGLWGDYKLSVGPGNSLSVGLVFLYDRSGDGNLITQKMLGSVAYKQVLTGPWKISIGFNGGFIQKKLDFNKLNFDSQWTPVGFNSSLPNNELNGIQNLNYFDLQGGLAIHWEPDTKTNLHLGFSMAHIIQPKESFYNLDNKLGMRPVIEAGGEIYLNPVWHLEPAFLYMSQKKSSEWIIGSNVGLTLTDKNQTVIYGGLWYRGVGDLMPAAGIKFKGIKALLSYDFNFYPVKAVSQSFGGTEISLIYTIKLPPRSYRLVIPCIRF